MDFIFMLTRDDATVVNALALAETAIGVGVKDIGFKDIGVDIEVLVKITERLREAGARIWMEVVATTRQAELRSLGIARELAVDAVMGGTAVDEALSLLAGSGLAYLPFAGRPQGHPTMLAGAPAEVEAHCRGFVARGCSGSDLLAYRAIEADPLDLVAAARRGLGSRKLVVAGSVSSRERIRALAHAGADAITVGTAAIDGSYAPGRGGLEAQLKAILADCAE